MRRQILFIVIVFWSLILGMIACESLQFEEKVSSASIENQIDAAIYKREEFLGTQAIVPLPTSEAYDNLIKLKDSNHPKVLAKLGEVAEKLEKFTEAENYFLKTDDLNLLAEFHHRRANFEKEAEILEKILQKEKIPSNFERLIKFSQFHQIDKYLQPQYFQQIAEENEDSFQIIENVINTFIEQNQKEQALKMIRQYKAKFPEKMLEKEVSLLSPKEAENVYYESFDPFWSDEQTENFYNFLSNNDRLRAYGSELKTKFRENNADYSTAVRLIHYQLYDYEAITPIILKLEKAKKEWSTGELLTIARLLLKGGNGDLASKFLYTLNVRQEFTPEMRGKIAYQIFKIVCNAENERLAITKGDLSFYRDIASADTNPGVSTGILSLVLSDTKPNHEMELREENSVKFFNRSAAFRIFQNYKKDFPNSPEIGQMYLDLIKIYTKAKDTELADKLLNEFAENYKRSKDFAAVALNLADAYVVSEKPDKEREIYQKTLDYLGKEKLFRLRGKSTSKVENTQETEETEDDYYYRSSRSYADSFAEKPVKIVYETVLEKLIASLSKEKKVSEILAVYSNEITKYPDQEWLYEQRLAWLEQTNLFDDQLKVYQSALEKFPTNNWRDKLARWYLKNKRETEFEAFSMDLVSKLNDQELAEYLTIFRSAGAFYDNLYYKLCEQAKQRFPHNFIFIKSLAQHYKARQEFDKYQKLLAEYYFVSSEFRSELIADLAKNGKLQITLQELKGNQIIDELFKAEANTYLSRYEEALPSYRKLAEIYPNNQEFVSNIVNLTRSFGQRENEFLTESSKFAQQRADFEPSNAVYRTENGEIKAELSDYKNANLEWQKLISTGKGDGQTHLETASVYWDYFQYDEALKTIYNYRRSTNNPNIYAFEAGAILEAQHKQNEAFFEYFKAMENEENKAGKRLEKLGKNAETFQKIDAVFHKQKISDWKTLNYAIVLEDLEKKEYALNLLTRQIEISKDSQFLDSTREYFDELKPSVFKRQAEIIESPRRKISFMLRLANFYRKNNQQQKAELIIDDLVKTFPTNYGVLSESNEFYWSLGKSEKAVEVLQSAYSKSLGEYRLIFAARLAKRLASLNRLSEAEPFLVSLHRENPADSDIFQQLTDLYVNQGKTDELRRSFADTEKAIRQNINLEPKEIRWQIASIRRQMITAFTQLKDYRSAIEQHIEIINREPDEKLNIEAAISYVKRYGEADLLLNYYQKTSAEAFKNHRWNLILAKIYEANNDLENTVKNYLKAIDNAPESAEPRLELVRIETNRKNYVEALNQLDQVIKIKGEDKKLLKQKAQLLQLLGRDEEANSELSKISQEAKRIIKEDEKFLEAERTKSIELYQQAFENLLQKPLEFELKAENITGYIQTLRQQENLDVIANRLFDLREVYLKEINRNNSTLSGEARKRLATIDAAMAETIGTIAKTVGTDEERKNLHENLSKQIKQTPNINQEVSLNFLENISAKSGYGDLVEKILIKRGNLDNLINFYSARGAFQKILEIAERKNDLNLIAENAKLLNDNEKELATLRQLSQKENTDKDSVLRYLEIVKRDEIEQLTKQNSPHQLELINFLIKNGEKKLAHQAIENSNFSQAWKLARNAESYLIFRDFNETNECYFCDALNFSTIGEFIKNAPNKKEHLIGKDWFTLVREYGEWLDLAQKDSADKFLVARIENSPNDASEQAKLGEYYLAKKDFAKAKNHLELSLELDDKPSLVKRKLGVAYWNLGQKENALKLIETDSDSDMIVYLETMQSIGLQRQACQKLLPVLVGKLDENEDIEALIYPIAKSFDSEKDKADFFLKLTNGSKNNELILQKIIQFELVSKEYRQPFFEKLLNQMSNDLVNYEFQEIANHNFSQEDAEEIYDHEHNFAEDNRERFDKLTSQVEYLEYLIDLGKTTEAKKLLSKIEADYKGNAPRSSILRLYHLQLFGGNWQKFVGIEVSDLVTNPQLPSINRLNSAVKVLDKLNRRKEADQLSLDFYARMLALEQYEISNFIGISRQLFKLGDKPNAFKIIQIMLEFEQEEKQAELAQTILIKRFAPPIPISIKPTNSVVLIDSLNKSAELLTEIGEKDLALKLRISLSEIAKFDFENKFALAQLLSKDAAIEVYKNLSNDRNSPRNIRWKAIWQLYKLGAISEISPNNYDAYSQLYSGISTSNESLIISSLIADNSLETIAQEQLITIYLQKGQILAALKIAENKDFQKDDELLTLLSESAEKIFFFSKAIEFEKAKTVVNQARIIHLEELEINKNKAVYEFVVNEKNTRDL